MSDESVSVLAAQQHIRRRRQQHAEFIVSFIVIRSWFALQQGGVDRIAEYQATERQNVQTHVPVLLWLLLVTAGSTARSRHMQTWWRGVVAQRWSVGLDDRQVARGSTPGNGGRGCVTTPRGRIVRTVAFRCLLAFHLLAAFYSW